MLVADREYIGTEWFEALNQAGIDWVVRLRKNLYRQQIDQAYGWRYSKMEHKARCRPRAVSKKITLADMSVTFVVVRNQQANAKEELL